MGELLRELLELLSEHGLVTALVTNNNESNTRSLLDRFELSFDVVLTRDSGLWKPSGAPISEAVARLDVPPDVCLAVGDSRYDVLAAREAGLTAICVVHDGSARDVGEVDLVFEDIPAFVRYLRVVMD